MGDPVNRRQVLTQAAVGGAIVWAAPVMTSSSAFAAGTLPPPPGVNLVLNPSFQDGSSGLTAPNWSFG